MQILYIDWACFGKTNVLNTLKALGHQVSCFSHPEYHNSKSESFENEFDHFVKGKHFDLCFSFNYFPVVSESCKKHDMIYVSVTYDSPYVFLYSLTILNKNNYIFTFDKQEYLTLRNGGISNIYYITLPANITPPKRLEPHNPNKKRYTSDVSFVGSLYTEKHNLYERLNGISDYTRGYLEGIMNAQLKIHGYNFIEEVLTPDILSDLDSIIPFEGIRSGAETPQYLYANYFISRKLTAMERQQTLSAVASAFPLNIYTWQTKEHTIPNATYMGPVDYYDEMPYVFANSKINLNITLRSIKSGIPLRAMDIMGAGGFLLTNFQSDFLDYFVPGEDFVYYDSQEDLLNKIDYFLSHEKERKEIALNGQERVRNEHNYFTFFKKIFDIISNES